jgi:NitT/TauT family transport system ATP-binding protein
MTGRVEQPSTPTADVRRTPASVPLPPASVDALSGLAEIMVPLGPLSVAELVDELYLEADDLLPLIDALKLLELAQVVAGQMELTPEGQTFAGADIPSKEMFAAAALARAPLVRALFNGLERAGDHTLRIGFFRDVLRRAFSEAETDRQLDMALDWGRYAALRQAAADGSAKGTAGRYAASTPATGEWSRRTPRTPR